MTSSPSPLAGLWDKTYQVAVVVRDLERAVSFYEALGIGPFTAGPSASTVRRHVYGQNSPETRIEGRVARLGPIEFELLCPVSGPSVQGDFLESRGEGVIHVCAYTDDLDRDITLMESAGYNVISYGELDDGGKFAYFDTREVGGLIFELFERGSVHR